ncbi:hypothetical protein SH661x_003114 [Planctomicrobium sp. SH661]|uniref:hypothetical protein n=1 Tax=Planctomicrobium sp. SH661 TaxID=3448124 RepID=UPI003F5C6BEF
MTLRISLACLAGCTLLVVSGCSDSPRREALGGGALSHVSVTLLTEATAEEATTASAGSTSAKIDKFGTFKGRIKVTGTAPDFPPLVAQGQQVKDSVCSIAPVPNESVIVGADGGLANVFVYLNKVPNVDIPDAPTEPVLIDQKGCKFVPHVSLIRVGQPLKMINTDPVAHNVKLTGVAMSFNSTIPGGDTVGVETSYQRPERGPIPMACDFHGWMQAYQLALNHPWAAITKDDGTFEITGVPAGPMEFVIWHEKAGKIEGKLIVDVPADGVVEKNFEVNASALSAQ